MPAPQWFVVRNGKDHGPFTSSQLKEHADKGSLQEDDLVRRQDMPTPIPASKLTGLFAKNVANEPPIAEAVSAAPSQVSRRAGWWSHLSPKGKLITVLSSIGIGLIFICCGGPLGLLVLGRLSSGPSGPAIVVSPAQLFSEYQANEVSADSRYKGKTVELTGVVGSIGKDILNNIYVTLKVDNNRFAIFTIQCFFSDKYEKEAAALSQGEIVTVRGVCEGKMGNVLIKHCQFVRNKQVANTQQSTVMVARNEKSDAVERWTGGTIEQFIDRMQRIAIAERPNIISQFDTKLRIANFFTNTEEKFFERFGRPDQNYVDFEKAPRGAPDRISERYRVWVYRCTDGDLFLRVQPTQDGTLWVSSHWHDN